MSAYTSPPVFENNVGQLISAGDLDILRHNIGLAEAYTWRWSEPVVNLGGVEVGWTLGNTANSDGNVAAFWAGYLMIKAGMTTLTVDGRNANTGASIFSIWIDGVQKTTFSQASTASWSQTVSLSGYAVGSVISIQVKLTCSGCSDTATTWVKDVYGSPLTFATAWPGVPSFGSQFTASQLNQLSNATSWVLNRTALIPRMPLLSMRYGLGAVAGPDRRPVWSFTVGRYYTDQQLHLGFQVADVMLPNLHTEVWINGSLAWDSGTHPQGTTNYDIWLSLSGAAVGTRAEVEIWSNQQNTIPRASMHFSVYTFWTATAMLNNSGVFSTPATTPAADTTLAASSLATYLNNLASIVSAAKARIDAQPNFYNRVRAQRRWIGRALSIDSWDDLQLKRNPPRFLRAGDALIVNGKGVSLAYGGISIPTNDRGIAFYDYKWSKSRQIIDGDKLGQQIVWLDTVPGVVRGTAYYLAGEVHWAEESVL